MFWKKKRAVEEPTKIRVERLPGPKSIPDLVGRHLIDEMKMNPDSVPILKAVVRKSPKGEKAFDVRVFDPAEAVVKKVQVKNYASLDEHPNLTIYQGWVDEQSKRVELEKKRTFQDVTIFTEAEILQKIEGLTEPGNTVFFYLARGPASGGPLGRGAAVVELNPSYPGKKQKKYNLYTADVDSMEPVGKGQKLFHSDKPKEIASWIKDAHHKRLY